jgi:O-antigen/teichoic acid export membrane protein
MKAEGRYLAKNSLALIISGGYTIIISVAFVPLLVRYLGREGYGVYSQVYSFVQLFGVLGHFGTNAILTREVARDNGNAPSLLGRVITLRVGMSSVFLGALAVAALVYPFSPQSELLLVLCALESVTRNIASIAVAIFRAFEVMEYELLSTFVDRTLWVIGVVVVIAANLGLTAVFVVFLVAAIVQLLIAFGVCFRRLARPHLGIDLAVWKALLREAWPIGVTQGSRHAHERVGIVQLAATVGAGEVGLFSGANRILQLTYNLTTSISTAMYPAMSASVVQEGDRLHRLVSIGLRTLLLVTLPVAALFLFFAHWFVPWLLGAEFREAALALQILAPAVVLVSINVLLSDLLRACGRQRYELLCVVVTLAGNLGLNLLLIPRLGYVGPAVAILVSQSLQSVLALAGVLPALGRLPAANKLLVPPIATLAMAGAWWLAHPLPLVIRLISGPVVYVAALILLGGIDRSAVHLFRSMLNLRSVLGQREIEGDMP